MFPFSGVGVSKLYLDTNALQFFRGLDEFLRWNDPIVGYDKSPS